MRGPKRDTEKIDGGITWSTSKLPKKWRRPTFLLRAAIHREEKDTERRDAVLRQLSFAINPTHVGAITAASLIKEIRLDATKLEKTDLASYSQEPHQHYSMMTGDKTLYLEFRRKAIITLSQIHEAMFNEPCDSLTSIVLTSFLHKKISEKAIKSTKDKLLPAASYANQ
jgi:hypothetical protein